MDDLETKTTQAIEDIIKSTPSYKAFLKYRPLVEALTLEEYAGLRQAVEMDRERRLLETFAKYPFTRNTLDGS